MTDLSKASEQDTFLSEIADILKVEEGAIIENGRHVLYKDHLGFDTIGYGRLVDRKKKGAGISEEEAEYLLDSDILNMMDELDDRLKWWRTLPINPRKALVLQAFQLGVPTLMQFSNQLEAMENKQFDLAAEHALKSRWHEQTPARAKRVAEMIRDV